MTGPGRAGLGGRWLLVAALVSLVVGSFVLTWGSARVDLVGDQLAAPPVALNTGSSLTDSARVGIDRPLGGLSTFVAIAVVIVAFGGMGTLAANLRPLLQASRWRERAPPRR